MREIPLSGQKLAIVIINYRTADLVIDCLNSFKQEIADDTLVVIVDNCSGDNSTDRLANWIDLQDGRDRFTLLQSPINGGFAYGNNLGIRSVKAEYYLLLNSDTLVRSGAITTLLKIADAHPEAGLIGPRLEGPDGGPQESCFRDHTPISEFIDSARTGPITKLLRKFNVPISVNDRSSEVQWISYACVLVRGEALEAAGLMDEEFFLYYEDAEHSYRIRKANWRILHVPEARIVHLQGGSTGIAEMTQRNRRLPRYYFASRSRYFTLLYSHTGLVVANMMWMAGRVISKIREIIERRETHVAEKQWRDIWH